MKSNILCYLFSFLNIWHFKDVSNTKAEVRVCLTPHICNLGPGSWRTETVFSDTGVEVGTNQIWHVGGGPEWQVFWLAFSKMVLGGSETSARGGCLGDYEKPHWVLLLRDPLWGPALPGLGRKERTTSLNGPREPRHKRTAGAVTKDWPHKSPGSWMAQGQGISPYFLGLMLSFFWIFSPLYCWNTSHC